jgi:hypothetical protein
VVSAIAADDIVRLVPRRLRRSPAERALAWLYLGPVGHLYGVVADVVQLGGRYAIARRLGRAPR